MNFDAIIFDCDGTLVDSERLGNQVLVDCAAEQGLDLTLEEALAEFMGGKMADAVAYIERRLGRPLPEAFVDDARRRMAAAFEAQLQPVEGVESMLRGLTVPYCVASSGPRDKIELSLGVTGLLPYFRGRIFSAYEVGRWKPEPDLFLHAAAALGVVPERCAVIEDSALGVQAGIAAGMTVFAYVADGVGSSLAGLDACRFYHMAQLAALLADGADRLGAGGARGIHQKSPSPPPSFERALRC